MVDQKQARTEQATDTCEVRISSEAPDWGDFLEGHPESTIYHDPHWGAVMLEAYGNRPIYLTAQRAGVVVGTLQLVHQRSLLFGSHVCSLPYFDAAGILAGDPGAETALIAAARKLLPQRKAEWVELRQMSPLDDSIPARTDKVTLQVELKGDPEPHWKGFKAKVRNQVRKAEKAGLTCTQGGGELLDEFCAIYVRNMRDLGSPPHSRRFFECLVRYFGDAAKLFVVRQGDKPVAASMTLRDRQAARVPWAGSDWRVRDLCANMLLYWEMLSDSCRSRAPMFDFGRSTRDAGTYRFKRQWGAEEVQLHWHYLLAEGDELPELRPDSPKYRMMVACWRKLPVWLARLLGPRIVRKLS
jgi:FemAB-related protein (PEP-CTERM system-associated)